MTETMVQDSLWVFLLIAFLAGVALGIITCAICAGWYDEIMEKMGKKKRR